MDPPPEEDRPLGPKEKDWSAAVCHLDIAQGDQDENIDSATSKPTESPRFTMIWSLLTIGAGRNLANEAANVRQQGTNGASCGTR